MLILVRGLEEAVEIHADGRVIVVRVLDIKRGRVRLGFEADKDVIIHREEVADRIRRGVSRSFNPDAQ